MIAARGAAVIVGGGVIGTACAWYMARDGWRVTVVDSGRMGGACSHGNCGLICPSHVLPLAEPRAFKSALNAILSNNSPFKIRPGLNLARWSWLWNFAKRCNQHSMVQAGYAIQALLASSMVEYERLVQVDNLDCEWQKRGLLYAYLDRRAWDDYDDTNRLLTEVYGEPARKLNAAEVRQLEPALKPTVVGGWYFEHDAHLRPNKLLSSWREKLALQGVDFIEQTELKRVLGSGQTANSIETNTGCLSADVFVVACGAWTPMLKEHVGCKIPIQPGKGYSITMPRPALCPTIPLILPEHRVAVTPMRSGYRLGSIMELVGYDKSIHPARLSLLRSAAEKYLHEPYCEPETETWYGWRPMTYDSVPVIDRSARWGNLWIAAGHNMLGMSMAPATGRLISELVSGQTTHIEPTAYRIDRF